jgi:hypothetical protein
MASAHDCPSRKLNLCVAAKLGIKCYAIKSEYAYWPNVLPFRRRQEKFWKSINATNFVKQFIEINSRKRTPFTALRLNESGDFHSQKCVDKAEQIAKELAKHNVKVYCYTSRKDLNFNNCKYLIVSGSGFKKKGVSNIFKIIKDLKERPKNYKTCKGDCKICKICQGRNNKTVVLAH